MMKIFYLLAYFLTMLLCLTECRPVRIEKNVSNSISQIINYLDVNVSNLSTQTDYSGIYIDYLDVNASNSSTQTDFNDYDYQNYLNGNASCTHTDVNASKKVRN